MRGLFGCVGIGSALRQHNTCDDGRSRDSRGEHTKAPETDGALLRSCWFTHQAGVLMQLLLVVVAAPATALWQQHKHGSVPSASACER